jgi:competence protein ComEC
MNPGQRVWEAPRVSRILGRLDVAYPDCITNLDATSRRDVRYAFERLRHEGLLLLDHYIAAPQDTLAGALLLGTRERLEKQRVEYFFHTGTIHLLAISGLHLGILTWTLFLVARNSRFRRVTLVILMAFSLAYCMLTGLRDPVLRAAVLVQVVCVGMFWRRNVLAFNALATAGVAVLLLRPGSLFQPGTQLSFLAVAVMIWIGIEQESKTVGSVEALIARTRPWYERLISQLLGWTTQLAVLGGVIWIVALPLVSYHFHLISPASLLLNVVLSAPIAISLLTGFAVMLLGRAAGSLAIWCGWICSHTLAFVELAVRRIHDLPGAYYWSMGPTDWGCFAYYFGLLVIILSRERFATSPFSNYLPVRKWPIVWICLWFTIPSGVELAIGNQQSNELRCTFLSVGHGTCVVLELPDDRVMLYDCGRMGVPDTGVRIVSEFLWHRRISRIDAVVLSHADADHYNLLPGLIERFPIGQVIVSPLMFNSPSPGVAALRRAINGAKVPIRSLYADGVMRFGDGDNEAVVRTLHPLAGGVERSDNANSLVLELSHQGKTILLPGDLESTGLEDVMSETPRDCDVLMAPHHGSLNSSPREFANWCTPEWVIVSSGLDPEAESKQREEWESELRRVLYTSRVGAVTITIRDRRLHVESFLPGS